MVSGSSKAAHLHAIGDVSTSWLSQVLNAEVTKFDFKRIGTGQVSHCFRSELEYADRHSGPCSVVLKLASDDVDSRTSARMLSLYSREVKFYLEAAPKIPGGAVAKVYHSSYDEKEDTCCILIEDLSPCVVGNDIVGCTRQQAEQVMKALGTIHKPFIANTEFEEKEWLKLPMQLPPAMLEALAKEFVNVYADRLKEEHKEIISRLVKAYEKYQDGAKAVGPVGVVHIVSFILAQYCLDT
jgi:hypothetical protein